MVDKQYDCQYCPHSFHTLDELRRHRSMRHSDRVIYPEEGYADKYREVKTVVGGEE